jgi:hypothetical protein
LLEWKGEMATGPEVAVEAKAGEAATAREMVVAPEGQGMAAACRVAWEREVLQVAAWAVLKAAKRVVAAEALKGLVAQVVEVAEALERADARTENGTVAEVVKVEGVEVQLCQGPTSSLWSEVQKAMVDLMETVVDLQEEVKAPGGLEMVVAATRVAAAEVAAAMVAAVKVAVVVGSVAEVRAAAVLAARLAVLREGIR